MDYEKLIEQLKQKDGLWCSVPTGEKLVTDAADALTALLAENERLRAELEQKMCIRDRLGLHGWPPVPLRGGLHPPKRPLLHRGI